jgi:hypothetical protein
LCVSILVGRPSLRNVLSRHYDLLCVCVILAAYTALIFPSLVLELRRSQFQNPDQPHVHWSIAYPPSSLLPIRICNDSDPIRSWSNSSDQSPVGCSNSLLSGSFFGTMLMGTLSPMIFRTSSRAALAACLLLSLLLLAACIATGTQPAAFGFPVAVQLATGALAAFFCYRGDRRSRSEFAVDKGLRYAAEQNGNLLFTLIPRDVVAHCRASDGPGMVGRTLPHVTLMFCALERHAEMQAGFSERDFHLLNALFVEFDDAVRAHGMYKYQHVGMHPICPPPPSLILPTSAPPKPARRSRPAPPICCPRR